VRSCVREWAVRLALSCVCIALSLTISGCVYDTDPPSNVNPTAAIALSQPYVLRPNDQIQLQVYNEPTVSGQYQVDGSGYLSLPLAGRVKAAGLTTVQLEGAITQHFDGGILKNPHVTVQVATYGPFYIRGEVKKPGQFPYVPGLTIGDAVALAGGYTYRANETKAYLRHAGAAKKLVLSPSSGVPVSPGDSIQIPERYF
jgi:polysaccharide biosynthesis/export protein